MKQKITISAESHPVLVCGAGLSHAAGVPLQAELASAVIPDGIAHIHNITRGHPSDAPVNIEEFLTSIDFEDTLEPTRSRKNRLNSKSYLRSLAMEIYNATGATMQSSKALESFFDQIAKLWDLVDVIITTNWDTLLECYAHAKYGIIDLSTCRSGRKTLLKVHGSIDWFGMKQESFSLEHFERIAGRYFRYKPFSEGNDLFHIYKSATKIIDDISPCIIAPTHLKEIPRGLFRRIWSEAYGALQRSRHVIIVGYSLPPSDRLMAELLMACRFPHVKGNKVERARLSIVDPDASGIVHQRYKALFGSETDFYRVGFTDVEFEVA